MTNELQKMSDARVELDVQIATAQQIKRDIKQSVKDVMDAISGDEELASGCIYSLPRGGKNLQGPSIRLAEMILQSWGNLHHGIRIVGNDGKTITAEAVVWDLEKNNRNTTQISRRITDRHGRTYNDDMQQVTAQAAASIALRNATFRVIPKVYVKKLEDHAIKVALGKGDIDSKRQRILAGLSKFGVTEAQVLAFLDVNAVSDISEENLTTLIGMVTAIKEGTLSAKTAFNKTVIDEEQQEEGLNNLNDTETKSQKKESAAEIAQRNANKNQ